MTRAAAALAMLMACSAPAFAQPSPDAVLARGVELARAGRLEEAGSVLENGRRDFPVDGRFALELAGIAYRRRDLGAAKSWLHSALQLVPSDPYGNDFLGTIYLLEGNLEAALQHWNRAGNPVLGGVRFEPAPELDPVLRERTFAASAGQVFTLERLRATEANLARLRIGQETRFELAPADDGRFELTVRSFDAGRLAGGWIARLLPAAAALPYEAVELDWLNLRRRALDLETLWRWDANKRRASVALGGPVALNPEWHYRFALDARDERWDLSSAGGPADVRLRRIEASADLQIGLRPGLEWTTGALLTRRQYARGGAGPFFSSGWGFESRNRLDSALWSRPEDRIRVDGSALVETGTASSRFLSVRGDLLGQARRPEQKLTISARLRAGKTFGSVPLDRLFMLGMERDNDLWLRGLAGDREGKKGNAPLGREYSLAQFDAAREVFGAPFLRVAVGPFFDTGRAADPSGSFGSKGWMRDTGVQATIRAAGRLTWTAVYGRDLRGGRGVFYTGISRFTRAPRRE